jgi:mycofactocin precursor
VPEPQRCSESSSAPIQEAHVDDELNGETVAEIEEELLVEEISIDGMCGVY